MLGEVARLPFPYSFALIKSLPPLQVCLDLKVARSVPPPPPPPTPVYHPTTPYGPQSTPPTPPPQPRRYSLGSTALPSKSTAFPQASYERWLLAQNAVVRILQRQHAIDPIQKIRRKEKEEGKELAGKQLQAVYKLSIAVTDPEEIAHKTGIWVWLTFLRYEQK